MKRHFIGVRKVNENNKFFINLFKKCLRCEEFSPTTHFKKVHGFLIHDGPVKNVFEEKPLNYTTIGEIRNCGMNFSQHLYDYYFYNSESLLMIFY